MIICKYYLILTLCDKSIVIIENCSLIVHCNWIFKKIGKSFEILFDLQRSDYPNNIFYFLYEKTNKENF